MPNPCVCASDPMMNGASTLEGYMPDVDATVVTRVLDAGATVVGKVHCEYFCFSGVLGPRVNIILFHASNSAGGCAFAVCVNHFATASSDGLALTAAVN